jgi:regulator of protease activity HflC (stomatin/prohibitin superfamily)
VISCCCKTAIVVPQQSAFIVERLGRYAGTLDAGFHILVPFVDVIRYRHSLKEMALDIPAQICITRDNVQVQVDGVLYLKVLNPERTVVRHFRSHVRDHPAGADDAAQRGRQRSTSTRRSKNAPTSTLQVGRELDKATEPWGVKVLRYEIKNITPPADILAAMEKQMRAEREKRAVILTSEGQRDAAINSAEGEKQQVIKASEARRQQQINEAEGQASAILAGRDREREGISRVAEASTSPGGAEAIQLKVAQQYIEEFGKVINNADTIILPSSCRDVAR